ncbi:MULTISPECIES: LysE/ArgO family amino acid transporter [Acinetobacter]|uniref:Amino acid transporter n=1 Tax=Acinetobacter junii TaxID=40215 RepID=A0A365PJC8_ACIJU|nr:MULTISPECIES: LysE/ArgO family amino acid transporter [Acinetobacter]RBA39912.1 amino acid transporter [Acinetobacter junii]RBA41267.1 amino acid transporter [Acinetobacter junii]RBA48257.1 amino acid transporter [Acinetobacter junii]WLF72081.1 LysE/ArgO family amino acid transporter [Acinetobacter junii]
MLSTYFSGFALGLSLILAIGAQNAFVLKQGLLKQHVFWVCLICALSDAFLICLGVFGFASILSQQAWLIQAMKYFGALFLFIYGARSFYNAYNLQSGLIASEQETTTFWQTIVLCLSFSWLNPHVYLDTVVLLGSISAQYADKISFASGAVSASFLFFFSLGFGARLLRPVFANPKAWKVLDLLIGCIMWLIALSLLR